MISLVQCTGRMKSRCRLTYQNLLIEKYGSNPVIPDTIKQLRELKQVLCGNKVENSSQYVDADNPGNVLDHVVTSDGSKWQNVDNADDIEKYIKRTENIPEKPILPSHKNPPPSIHISDVPRVKVIAEKYSRYKSNNIELRRLDEKVVCLEYDVYDKFKVGDTVKPVQVMRAFFNIKPAVLKNCIGKEIPPDVKRNFKITDADLERLNDKEVEIIDAKIKENIPYLDDLKRILHRSQIVTAEKTNNTALDLLSLYEMARNEHSPFDREFSGRNFLTKAELDEVKDLILTKCTSSVHGTTRRKIKKGEEQNETGMLTCGVISESIVAELMRENGTKQCL